MNPLISTYITIVMLTVYIVALLISLIQLKIINIKLYFLKFDFRKFPQMAKIVEDTLYRISQEQGITVYNRTDHELNGDVEEKEKILGRYVYPSKTSKIYKKYQKYRELVKDIIKSNPNYLSNNERFAYPQILLVNKDEHFLEVKGYFATFFHELGHHFAIELENLETEEDADRYAWRLVCENLPDYFKLIFWSSFKLEKELTGIEILRLYFKFIKVKNSECYECNKN